MSRIHFSWISVVIISCMALAGIMGGDYTVWNAYAQSNTEKLLNAAADTNAIRQHLNLGMGEGVLSDTNTERLHGIALDTNAIRQHLNLGMGEGVLSDTNTERLHGIALDTNAIRQHLNLGMSVVGGSNSEILHIIATNTDVIREYYGLADPSAYVNPYEDVFWPEACFAYADLDACIDYYCTSYWDVDGFSSYYGCLADPFAYVNPYEDVFWPEDCSLYGETDLCLNYYCASYWDIDDHISYASCLADPFVTISDNDLYEDVFWPRRLLLVCKPRCLPQLLLHIILGCGWLQLVLRLSGGSVRVYSS